MNKKTRKYVALSLLVALFVCTIYNSNVSKAEKTTYTKKAIICTVNNVSRTLTWSDDGSIYFKIGASEPIQLFSDSSLFLSIKFDKYGTCWTYENDHSDENDSKYVLRWWNYDILPDSYIFKVIPRVTSEGLYEYVDDIESLILDSDNDFIIGYKTFSGKEYAIPTPEDMKKILSTDDYLEYPQPRPLKNNSTPSPSPSTPVTSPNISIPSTIPTSNPSITSPNANSVTPTPAVTKKSVKKKAGYSCLSVGSKVTSKYKLTKGKLTWKGNGKTKKFSGVKSAGFIKKSGNLVFMTKQGKVYTLSSKGKKKCIVKKKAKKLIVKNKFVVKVKVGKKFINLANK